MAGRSYAPEAKIKERVRNRKPPVDPKLRNSKPSPSGLANQMLWPLMMRAPAS